MAIAGPMPLRRLALRTSARTLVFAGRADRWELASFLVCAIGLDVILNLAFRLALEGETEAWARLAADTVLFLPVYALLARRLHDLDRSGWWSLFPALVMLRGAALKAVALAGHPNVRDWIESTFEPLNWILVPGFLMVVIAAAFVPGNRGVNRFGPVAEAPPSPVPQSETADADTSAPAA